MQSLTVLPLSGIGPIRLGSARRQVHDGFGAPESSYLKASSVLHETDSWYGGAAQVFYAGAAPEVEYIELSRAPNIDILLYGVSVFVTPATDLVALLASKCQLHVEEAGTSYIAPDLELAFWRPTPDEKYFATIGVGVRGYFSGQAA